MAVMVACATGFFASLVTTPTIAPGAETDTVGNSAAVAVVAAPTIVNSESGNNSEQMKLLMSEFFTPVRAVIVCTSPYNSP
jgi:hypothetical protein